MRGRSGNVSGFGAFALCRWADVAGGEVFFEYFCQDEGEAWVC